MIPTNQLVNRVIISTSRIARACIEICILFLCILLNICVFLVCFHVFYYNFPEIVNLTSSESMSKYYRIKHSNDKRNIEIDIHNSCKILWFTQFMNHGVPTFFPNFHKQDKFSFKHYCNVFATHNKAAWSKHSQILNSSSMKCLPWTFSS